MEQVEGNVKGIAILGENGERVLGMPFPAGPSVREMEREIFSKAKAAEGEVLLYSDLVVVYKMLEDVCIVIYGASEENELLLHRALEVFYSAALRVLKGPLTRKSLLKSYDQLFLLLDVFLYKGIILTDSAEELYRRTTRRTFEGLEAVKIPSKFSSVFKKAQSSIKNSWFKG
jgi:Clathrin adaptor complex small chain